eukprot:TRINITY_DN1622_c0_g1_i1.p1 TRINITY_DN1622_c0_g1~~TRINITY_DN1622_c0_g1_i1.p1  ORF type:complete len:358 (+),score=63.85 TRINITY_DN1622_c0_g1_i1:96-1169(+)
MAPATTKQVLEAKSPIAAQCITGSMFTSAVAETQGPRPSYEDAYAVKPGERTAFFWIFDGHRGDAAAHFVADEFSCQNFGVKGEDLPSDKRIIHAFSTLDKKLQKHLEGLQVKKAGSTAVGALTMRHDDGTYSAKLVNCGDSRGVVIRAPNEQEEQASAIQVRLPESLEHICQDPSQNWSEGASWLPDWPAVVETIDHKPNQRGERARIEAAGGEVLGGRCARIDGNLAVSRGLGDFDFKDDCRRSAAKQKVSCVPDIYEVHGMPEGSLILLACDGLWDVMGTEEAADFVRERLQRSPPMSIPAISRELVRHSLEAESSDNVTVLLVQLGEVTMEGCSDAASTNEGDNTDSSDDESS